MNFIVTVRGHIQLQNFLTRFHAFAPIILLTTIEDTVDDVFISALKRAVIAKNVVFKRNLLRDISRRREAVTRNGGTISWGIYGSSAGYARAIELGLVPPAQNLGTIQQLTQWVQTKLGITNSTQARRVAFLIRRKIMTKGMRRNEFFMPSFNANRNLFLTRLFQRLQIRFIMYSRP